MTSEKSTHAEKTRQFEDRIKNPAYILFVVVVLIFLIIGFVNLIDHTSRNPIILGRYSAGTFLLLVLYGLVMAGWAALLLRPNSDTWLKRSLDFVQNRPPLAIAFLVFCAVLIGQFFYRSRRWLEFPALQALVIVLVVLGAGLVLFYRWGDETRPQTWRKFIVYPLAFLLAIELILQALSFFGVLPSFTTTTDSFAPYNRVYQTEEGFGNTAVNNFGWHYPQFRLIPDSYRILVLGDTFIQALQVKPEENLGIVLEKMINEEAVDTRPVEVLGLGNPDFGPGLYLSPLMTGIAIEAYNPDKAIAFFDLGSDFQTSQSAEEYVAHFIVNDEGVVEIHPDNWLDFHMVEHDVYRGYEKVQFAELVKTHYLTRRLINSLFQEKEVIAAEETETAVGDINLSNAFVFYEETNDEALTIATGLIDNGYAVLQENGIDLSLVTIPVFTDEFLAQDQWQTQFGDSDLLLPERELRAYAAEKNIPFLGLGAFMEASGMVPADLKALFFNEGKGHFTPEGHAWAAKAVYDCFFKGSIPATAGCDSRLD